MVPYLLPLSGGSWLPTFDWALLSRLDTSLSSAPRKRSRKESVLWASWCKCLVVQACSEMIRRDILEGHGQAASAERKETESPLFQGWGGSRDDWQDMGPGGPGLRCASLLHWGFIPFSSRTCHLGQSFLDKGHCLHYNFVLLTLGVCQRRDPSNGALAAFLLIIPFVELFVMTGKHRNRKESNLQMVIKFRTRFKGTSAQIQLRFFS